MKTPTTPKACYPDLSGLHLLNLRIHIPEIIDPAVNGTVGILNSTLKYGFVSLIKHVSSESVHEIRSSTDVKRIVITSSVAAIMYSLPEHKVFTELDVNEQGIQTVEKEGREASGMAKYSASKTLAEKGKENSRFPITFKKYASNINMRNSCLGSIQKTQRISEMGPRSAQPALRSWRTLLLFPPPPSKATHPLFALVANNPRSVLALLSKHFDGPMVQRISQRL